MGKQSIYEGLKNALVRNAFPHYGLDDNRATILFESWDQFRNFDKFLDNIDTYQCKLNIYTETVNGKSDGVAVTVDDEIQHFDYMQSRLDMESKLKEFENFISKVLRTGVQLLNFNYKLFFIEFDEYEFYLFDLEFKKNPKVFLTSQYYISKWKKNEETMNRIVFHVEFPN